MQHSSNPALDFTYKECVRISGEMLDIVHAHTHTPQSLLTGECQGGTHTPLCGKSFTPDGCSCWYYSSLIASPLALPREKYHDA